MPYEIREKGSQYCVYKQGTNEVKKCYSDKAKATKLLRALYANVPDATMSNDDNEDVYFKGNGDSKKPYGNVTYADPGYQADGKARYPLDSEEHIRAAWSYINVAKNAAKYASDKLALVKAKIKAAMKRIGADVNMNIDATVSKSGKIFEIGIYPDKNFEFSEEDAANAIINFEPVDFEIEHMPSLFDGKLGKLTEIDFGEDGKSITGKAEISQWVTDVLGTSEIPVSCVFDREDKKIKKIGIVRDPRVSDAALFASFARHDTSHGQSHLQSIHDMAASHGAVCDKKNVQMASSHEAKAMQDIHDICTEHGAICSMKGSKNDGLSYYSNGGNEPMSAEETKEIKSTLEKGFESLKALFSGNNQEKKENDPKVLDLEKQIAKMKEDSYQQEANFYADTVISKNLAKPGEKANLVAFYAQAKKDDDITGTKVSFSDGKETKEISRVDAFKASIEARTPHVLTSELVSQQVNGAKVLFNSPEKDELDKIYEDTKKDAERMNGRKK